MGARIPSKAEHLLEHRLSQILILAGVLTTLVVNPWSNYDPISLPKMTVMFTGATACIFIVAFNGNVFINRLSRFQKFIFVFFPISLFVPLLFSGADVFQQIWGMFGRNTGVVTYLGLLFLMSSAAMIQKRNSYENLIRLFVVGSLPITIYCIIQFFKLDPIPWSEKFVFGTLGNVNFLSAYLSLVSLGCLVIALKCRVKTLTRVSLALLVMTNMGLATSTQSIQGPIIFVVGTLSIPFFLILASGRKNLLKYFLPYSAFLSIGFASLIFALFNKGPLAKLVFQPSVIFRGDYMHAGWEMFLSKPFFGVGMDSYGDWYREMRGEISTLRTGPNRTANTAHNIFLDLASNGGVLVATSYVLLLFMVIWSIIRMTRNGKVNNPFVLASVVIWVAYQVQALVSINQIGVGVWGWIFSGVIIGMDRMDAPDSFLTWRTFSSSGENSKKWRGKPLPPAQALVVILGFAIGFVAVLPPLRADMGYRAASNQGNFEAIYQSSRKIGSTQQHRELVLDLAMKNNLVSESRLVAEELVRKYPRNSFGWRVLSVASASTPEERAAALQKTIDLDPFNPELRTGP
jgi:hypothetical protein